jgi:hypothetical protein
MLIRKWISTVTQPLSFAQIGTQGCGQPVRTRLGLGLGFFGHIHCIADPAAGVSA